MWHSGWHGVPLLAMRRRPGGRGHTQPRNGRAAPAHPWAVRQPAPEGLVDDWVLDLRETMLDGGAKPALASLAPEDDEAAPELIERYSGQPLPSRR